MDIDKLLEEAIEGDMVAQCEVGLYYERNRMYDKAVFWLEKAAEQGYDYAQYQLAINYEKGLGVTKDYEKAAYYFLLSAKQGFKSSMFELATSYEIGRGVEKNLEKAKYWRDKYYELD